MACTEKHKALSRAWYARNREHQRELRKVYYRKNKQAAIERVKLWRKANPEKHKENAKRYVTKHSERLSGVYSRLRAKRKERLGIEGLRAEARARSKLPKYRAINRANSNRRRRAMKFSVDSKECLAFYEEAVRLTTETGIPHEVDHIIPLKHPLVCGLHNKFNLRVITAVENRRKKNKFDVAAYNAKLREQYV